MAGYHDIRALAELLYPNQEEQEPFDDEQQVKTNSKKSDPYKRKIVKEEPPKKEEKLEQDCDYDNYASSGEINDWRKCPHWELSYKQSVTPSDVFLQMSGKTQLTSSCEEMVITIDLPGEQCKNIDVKVSETHLDLLSPLYRLSVPLPHPVDPKQGNDAKWHPDEEKLKLTLTMEREFDYVNF